MSAGKIHVSIKGHPGSVKHKVAEAIADVMHAHGWKNGIRDWVKCDGDDVQELLIDVADPAETTLANHNASKETSMSIPKLQIVIQGEAGTGKTSLAQAIAGILQMRPDIHQVRILQESDCLSIRHADQDNTPDAVIMTSNAKSPHVMNADLAWEAVCATLTEVDPQWTTNGKSGITAAVKTILKLAPPSSVRSILDELDRARHKHPIWPEDPIHGAAIVAEESGELIRAALQAKYEKRSLDEAIGEAIQTAAVCIRFIEGS